ncbi:hypothetical protein ACU635_31920 [[Actinomadura] parvosata]|uniref:hypothetical protein n=1 Tax=[Actinomadura] parvosata TaxID=1955412 RepID=UPI00406D045A
MTQTLSEGGATGEDPQNVVRAVTDFLQQVAQHQEVPQDLRERAGRLKASLAGAAGGQ